MNHISNSTNYYFTRNSLSPSSSRQANSQRQPAIRSFPENNVETGIDIHSIDYEFPLQKKVGSKAAEAIAGPGIGVANGKAAADQFPSSTQINASKPIFKDPISTGSKNPETSATLEPPITNNDEEISGFSVNSFLDSIRFTDSFSLELHIEHGFKGSHEFMLGTDKYSAFDYAMHCKNFSALMALAPTINAGIIISSLEKNPAFIHEYRHFSMQLFNALNG